MRLEIRRKPKAAEDILSIWAYVAADSLRSADSLIDRFDAIFVVLSSYPDIGIARPELGKGLKSLPEGRFVIFYRHDARVLDIVRVVAAARKLGPDFFEA